MRKGIKAALLILALFLLGGCGAEGSHEPEIEDIRQSVTDGTGGTEEDIDSQASDAEGAPWKLKRPDSDETGMGSGGSQSAGMYAMEDERLRGRQITEQSFQVALDGWGEVAFASFEPEYRTAVDESGQVRFGDARFALLQDGHPLLVLPGENEENAWYGRQFSRVLAISFQDYNEDGRVDILLLLEYTDVQADRDEAFRTVRLYTQEEGEREFHVDASAEEYVPTDVENMAQVKEELAKHAFLYQVATEKSAWEVERFARMVKREILEGDFDTLCDFIAFPIMVGGVSYRDREAFMEADFVRQPNQDFLESLQREKCENLFASSQGIMLGDGLIWIAESADDRELKVIGLNGM